MSAVADVEKELEIRKNLRDCERAVHRSVWRKFDAATSKAHMQYLMDKTPAAKEIYDQEMQAAKIILDAALAGVLDKIERARESLWVDSEIPRAPVHIEESEDEENYDDESEIADTVPALKPTTDVRNALSGIFKNVPLKKG